LFRLWLADTQRREVRVISTIDSRRGFRLVLIKPDDEVIQWFRSSNQAAVYGLAMDCAAKQVLGRQIGIVVNAYDETNTRIRPERIARDISNAGDGMVGLVGVQSNQHPRASPRNCRRRSTLVSAVCR
jgi:hypothetical protein